MTLRRALGFTAVSLLMPCLLLGLLAGCKTNQPTAAQLQPLQGTWEGYQLGEESEGKVTITIAGNSLHLHRDTNYWFETTFTLPAGPDPQRLHVTIKRCASPWEGSEGKGHFAIYKIEDGTLTLAASSLYDPSYENGIRDGFGPPKAFPSTPGGEFWRFDLKQAQPQKMNTLPLKSK